MEAFSVAPTHVAAQTCERWGCPQAQIDGTFQHVQQRQWEALLKAGGVCCTQAAIRRRRIRHRSDNVLGRVARAEALVQVELSSARQVLEGAQLAPGFHQTLQQLRDQSNRPSEPRVLVPPEVINHRHQSQFDLDGDRFLRNLRSARRGAAAGPSGMTVEHLQPLLDHSKDAKQFTQVAELLSRAEVPASVRDAVRLGRLTALRKPDGGVRGIVAGNIIRRLVAWTMSQQLMEDVERETAPFQNALSTRAGCECIAHALQGIIEFDPRATVMSIDFDQCSHFGSRPFILKPFFAFAGEEFV